MEQDPSKKMRIISTRDQTDRQGRRGYKRPDRVSVLLNERIPTPLLLNRMSWEERYCASTKRASTKRATATKIAGGMGVLD
jgi:hypothetical protein